MNIQLVTECLGFRTALAMLGIAVINCAAEHRPLTTWVRELVLAITTALAANMMRIQVLYWISRNCPDAFGAAHDYLGYVAMATAMCLWLKLRNKGEQQS